MDRPWRIAAIAGLGVLLATPVAALQILPIEDNRSVSWVLQNGTPEQLIPGPGFPVFDAVLNIVGGPSTSQTTAIGATEMGGEGGVFVNTDEATDVRSAFDITFRVDEAVAYELSGEDSGPDTTVVLSGPGGVLFEVPPSTDFTVFTQVGTLLPGTDYRLVLAVDVPGYLDGWGGYWSFQLALVPLPEPSHLPALGAALLVAATGRRRLDRRA